MAGTHIVMTPKCKTANSTTLIIERRQQAVEDQSVDEGKVHVAGGDHKGIVINKQAANDYQDSWKPAHISLRFRVFLVSAQTKMHTQEQRTLHFWFADILPTESQPSVAQEFFRELVSPLEFPRDYVGFIKKIMKLMQHKYPSIDKLEVELKQINEPLDLPVTPSESILGNEKIPELTSEKVRELIESAYPNPLTVEDLVEQYKWDAFAVEKLLGELCKKGLIEAMDHGAYTRAHHKDTQIKIVKHMPVMASSKQPTIAIITAQYCEKLAVDSMIENKETFVRYTTVGTTGNVENSFREPKDEKRAVRGHVRRFGESNVYTLGDIGAHRIVCTKLPTVGHTREAMTAAGNTTTRLLGTFQKVDYVFLVGVGGGVPHYTDYKKHVRLGDVVVSHPVLPGKQYVYAYCESAKADDKGSYQFETKEYTPSNMGLEEIAASIALQSEADSDGYSTPWRKFLRHGSKALASQSEHNFNAPPVESDKLYMTIGDRDVIEVAHPTAPEENFAYKRSDDGPRIHLAPIASGRRISRDDQLRQKFASRFGVLAFDAEMDAVVESILGNCRESFVVVRGISDYKDGSGGKDWQPYASLVAASVVKAMICAMDPPTPGK